MSTSSQVREEQKLKELNKMPIKLNFKLYFLLAMLYSCGSRPDISDNRILKSGIDSIAGRETFVKPTTYRANFNLKKIRNKKIKGIYSAKIVYGNEYTLDSLFIDGQVYIGIPIESVYSETPFSGVQYFEKFVPAKQPSQGRMGFVPKEKSYIKIHRQPCNMEMLGIEILDKGSVITYEGTISNYYPNR